MTEKTTAQADIERSKRNRWTGILIAYLLTIGIWSSLIVAFNIPDLGNLKPNKTLPTGQAAQPPSAEDTVRLELARKDLEAAKALADQAAKEQETADKELAESTDARKSVAQSVADEFAARKTAADKAVVEKEAALEELAERSPAPGKLALITWDFFPGEGIPLNSVQSVILLLAFFSGIAGSFIHAAQSLASYVGNQKFRLSWFAWYFLRPWIGGVLGLAIVVVFSAGLVGQGSISEGDINIYGVVALALLGGWFSKNTSDKLKEVFETLFKTNADESRKDKLKGNAAGPPRITGCDPNPVPAGVILLVVKGAGFQEGLEVKLDDTKAKVTAFAEEELTLDISDFDRGTAVGRPVKVVATNPGDNQVASSPFEIEVKSEG